MYIYGGSILSLLTLVVGLIDAAIQVVTDFYIARLIPWPIDELLLAATWVELVVSHGVTIGVGQFIASMKWWSQ